MSRRFFLKITSAVFLSFHFFVFLSKKAGAEKSSDNLIDEQDTLAKAMQYRHDASRASVARTNKKAFCYNCSKYNVCMAGDSACKPLGVKDLGKAKAAPCQIFKSKTVARNGWCLSWESKS